MKEMPSIPVREIMTALGRTEAGRSLASTVRWKDFRNGESVSEWKKIVGVTAIDTLHSQLMYGVGRAFLARENGRFSSEDAEILLYGCLAHDFGEAIIDGAGVGDVSASLKTAEHEKVESVIARQAIASLPIEDDIKEKLLYGYEQVVEGGNPDLQRAFKALEKTEYVMTVLKVFQNDRRREQTGQSVVKDEELMIGRVLVIRLREVLETYVGEFPDSIGFWLHTMTPVIDQAYAFSRDWLRANGEITMQNHNAMCDAFEARWKTFKNEKRDVKLVVNGRGNESVHRF